MNRPHPWMPMSPCGKGCLPPAGSVPAVGRVRRVLRLLAAAAMLLGGVVLAVMLPLLGPAGRERALRAWFRALLGVLRIQLVITGGDRFAAPGVGVLVVSNHMSWLDLIALGAVQPLRMVAKSEVAAWPLIGLLARRAGTIFVDRKRLSTLPRTIAAVSGALAGGAAIGAFPEGTTWCGLAGGRFRPAVFQAAADTATPVRPVALRYRLASPGTTTAGTTTVAAFVGSTTLWEAAMLVAGVRGLVVEVALLPLLLADGPDRRALAASAEAAVTAGTLPLVHRYAGVSMTYLDHAATTPMLPEAVAAMSEALSTLGNASSLHGSGRRARRTVEESRESIAAALGARPSEVVFTGGGTEGDNLAVKGLFWERRSADPRRRRVLASAVEHHAVLDAVSWLADHEGAEVGWLEVDAHGRVHPETLRAALAPDPGSVALVTVMWANNEVGTVAPVHELAEIAAGFGVPLHTDAVQAVGQLPVHFGKSGAAALTLTGHKLGGPYGAGVLLLGREVAATPLLHGGGQERDVRSGTLDVPAIAGLATAIRQAVATQPHNAIRLGRLRDQLVDGIRARVPDAVLNGDSGDGVIDGGLGRLPGNAHLTFPGCEGDSLLMLLDARGIECSTGAACTAGVAQPSHVLLAMGAAPAAARGSLRFSLGHTSAAADVADVLDAIEPVVTRARGAGVRRSRAS